MPEVDVAVVGAGIMGAATAWWLARSGATVALVERFTIGHPHGSSHGRSRIFRLSYPDALHVGMAQDALPLWRELEAEAGETLLDRGGGLDTGAGLEERARALAGRGAAFELLDRDAVAARFPQVSLPRGGTALHQPDGAVIHAGRAWHALARVASAHGARLLEGTRVLGIGTEGGGAVVRTAGEDLSARAVVVTAGGWARGLLAGAGVDLPAVTTRESVAYFALDGGGPPPPTLVEWGGGGAHYALPSPGEGLKAGCHRASHVVDPDSAAAVDAAEIGRIADWVRERFPAASPEAHRAETCLYTNTADEGFILERHGPLVVGSACSGHGFKFAPLIGRRLAALALER
ncbi:MAG TPA: FAD-dependent oxidoreductase [Candidatus Dormibacteraeota bacterium]|nr:FAD-dependent oxidoreductase [Candidatus Dormibacteraeota bacterium]